MNIFKNDAKKMNILKQVLKYLSFSNLFLETGFSDALTQPKPKPN